MSIIHPSWRYILALKSNNINPSKEGLPYYGGKDVWNEYSDFLSTIVQAVGDSADVAAILNDDDESRKIYDAYRLFKIRKIRVYIEAYWMSGGSNEWITSSYGIDDVTLKIYQLCFFDFKVFTGGIDKIAYIETLQNKKERDIKQSWFRGPEHIKWLMGTGSGDINIKTAMNSLLFDAVHKQKNTSNQLESIKWADVAAKIGSVVAKEGFNSGSAQERLQQVFTLDLKEYTYKPIDDDIEETE